mmetsp:Transcript_11430/g.23182  ORF Transcript_11430/g.23182 Transcript_11430/m.23182 type:complete len:83 (+) Transcript_11430:74-322(+)
MTAPKTVTKGSLEINDEQLMTIPNNVVHTLAFAHIDKLPLRIYLHRREEGFQHRESIREDSLSYHRRVFFICAKSPLCQALC